MPRNEYEYPNGKVLTADLAIRVNQVVGFLPGRLPFSALYIDPSRAFLLHYRYPEDLKDLYNSYTPTERRVTKQVYGALMSYLYNEAVNRDAIGGIVETEEYSPTLEYVRRFSPLGLKEARGVSRIGALYIYHSIKPFLIDL